MLRKWLGPRALLWHFLLIVIVSGCLIAAWWQVHRAADGNTLSYFYSVEWPIFALVAVIGWWQLIMEDPSEVEARKAERRRRGRANPIAYDQEVLRREIAARPDLIKAFPQLARAFPDLVGPQLAGAESAALARGSGGGAPTVVGAAVGPDAVVGPGAVVEPSAAVGADAAVGPVAGPLVHAPGDGVPAAVVEPPVVDDGERGSPADELRAYNDALAALAAKGKAKTWRNPYGR